EAAFEGELGRGILSCLRIRIATRRIALWRRKRARQRVGRATASCVASREERCGKTDRQRCSTETPKQFEGCEERLQRRSELLQKVSRAHGLCRAKKTG